MHRYKHAIESAVLKDSEFLFQPISAGIEERCPLCPLAEFKFGGWAEEARFFLSARFYARPTTSTATNRRYSSSEYRDLQN